MIVAGKAYKDVAKECGFYEQYLRACVCSDIGKEERARVESLIEATYADKMAGDSSGADPIAVEVKEGTLEAIRQLRSIMLTARSETARAIAAKEIIELGQLKTRLKSLGKPIQEEEMAEISTIDLASLARTIADLKEVSLIRHTVDATTKKDAMALSKKNDFEDLSQLYLENMTDAPMSPEELEENAAFADLADDDSNIDDRRHKDNKAAALDEPTLHTAPNVESNED